MASIYYIIFILAICAFFGFFEWLMPAERGQPLRERCRNLVLIGIFLVMGGVVAERAALMLPALVPIVRLPMVATILISMFISDLIFYWYHRAEHAFAWFWPIHELHHSDEHMNATTSLRTFWLENPMQTLLISVPVSYVMSADARTVFWLTFVTTVWLFFTHANWRLRLGRLTPIICGPQFHRIHHSKLPEHRDKNFAQAFPVIDIIFGTYYAPGRNEFSPTGMHGLTTRVPIVVALTKPFRAWIGTSQPENP